VVLVVTIPLWQFRAVRNKLHRCFVALGVLAMALALVAIPAGIALASAKSDTMVMVGSSDDMPCHHPCPGCVKPCPDMGSCLLKCFQTLANTPGEARVQHSSMRQRIPLLSSRRMAEAPIPPLLRPPSV